MGTSPKSQPQIVVVLKLPKNRAPLFITRAASIVEHVAGNPWFPAPSPSLGALQQAIDELAHAQTKTLTRTVGTASVRDDKRRLVAMLLRQLSRYVEAIAQANQEQAASIVASADMYLKKTGGRTPQVLSAEQGDVSGHMKVRGFTAGDRAIHEFEYSIDGRTTWIGTGPSTKATVTVKGLKPGTKVDVRQRITVKGVTGNWSNPIEYIAT